MTKIQFDLAEPLIIVWVTIEYKKAGILKMALDTGSSKMLITPKVAKELGYDIDHILKSESLTTASREEQIAMVNLKSVSIDTEKVDNLKTSVKELPEILKIDGAIGLNYLRHFETTINFSTATVTLERI